MAQDQDIERELPASQKRLDEAREHGQAPRSRELTSALLMLAGGAGIVAGGPLLVRQATDFQHGAMTVSRAAAFDTGVALQQATLLAGQGASIRFHLADFATRIGVAHPQRGTVLSGLLFMCQQKPQCIKC